MNSARQSIAALAAVLLWPLAAAAQPETVTRCDELANHPSDPLKVTPGIAQEDVDTAAAKAACAEALANGACSADVVLNILYRRRQPAAPAPIPTPESLCLRFEPAADCSRYDRLRGRDHGAP